LNQTYKAFGRKHRFMLLDLQQCLVRDKKLKAAFTTVVS